MSAYSEKLLDGDGSGGGGGGGSGGGGGAAAEGYAPAPASAAAAESMQAKKAAARTQLWKIMGICVVFMGCEVLGGYLAGSLAIMTDAAHLLSDAASFAISLSAVWMAERPRSARATFGYHRVEIVGAMASVLLIWALTAALCVEAVNRIIKPEPVDGRIMFITAVGGLFVNLLMMRVLHSGGGEGGGHHGHSHAGGGGHGHSHGGGGSGGGGGGGDENYSVRAAYIHILGDFVQTIGVLIAAAMIWARPDWHLADPICTFTFSILVLFTTFNIVGSAYHTLLNSVPESVSLPRLAVDLVHLPAVRNVHDLHVWSFGQDRLCLTAHIIVRGGERERVAAVAAASAAAARFGIRHSTFQVELEGSGDVETCERYNDHVDECSLSLQDPDTSLPSLFVIERPAGSRSGSSGTTPKAPGVVLALAADHHGHAHGPGGDHGHSHAGGSHGHAH